jgi:superfamily II DNA or RNA helicase
MTERTLRPHQLAALRGISDAMRAGYRSPVLVAPTGFGKTEVMAKIAEAYVSVEKTVLSVSPRISLVDQTEDRFRKHDIGHVGIMQARHHLTDATAPVQVASMQTLERRGFDRLPDADVVLVDECHILPRFLREWMSDPRWACVPFIGFSATPGTTGLGRYYDTLVPAATTQDLIGAGYLSPFKAFAPASGLLPDLKGVKTRGRDYARGDLSKRMQAPQLVADTVSTWKTKARGRPTLTYAVDRAHGKMLQEKFCEAGIEAAYIDAYTPLSERKRICQEMEAGRIEVCVSIGTLTLGVDWPFVSCIQLCRPTKSAMLYTQIIGRGLRTHPGKDYCLVLDHTSSTQRLGLVTDITWTELDDGKPKPPAAQREREEPKPVECKNCQHIKPPRTPTCPECGYTMHPVSKVTTIKGTLQEVTGKSKQPTRVEKQQWYSMFLHYALQHGYKKGWAYHKYREKFGVAPGPQIKQIVMAPNAEVLGWIKSRTIAYARGRGSPERFSGRAA